MSTIQPSDQEGSLDIESLYGAPLIGVLFSCVLWGISCMQLFFYFLNYESDHAALKSFVVAVWVLDTTNQILTAAGLWPVLILKWGSSADLFKIPATFVHRVWVAALGEFAVQMFFLYRIHRLGKGRIRYLVWTLAPLALWQVVGGIFFVHVTLDTTFAHTLSNDRETLGIEISLRSASAFVDILIACAMVHLLLQKRNTELMRSRNLVSRLIISTVHTGLWTALIALLEFAFMLAFPHGLQFCAFEFTICSLYVNTLLGNLNARQFLRRGDTSDVYEMNFRTAGGATPKNASSRSQTGAEVASLPRLTDAQDRSIAIRVNTTEAVHTDLEDAISRGKCDVDPETQSQLA